MTETTEKVTAVFHLTKTVEQSTNQYGVKFPALTFEVSIAVAGERYTMTLWNVDRPNEADTYSRHLSALAEDLQALYGSDYRVKA